MCQSFSLSTFLIVIIVSYSSSLENNHPRDFSLLSFPTEDSGNSTNPVDISDFSESNESEEKPVSHGGNALTPEIKFRSNDSKLKLLGRHAQATDLFPMNKSDLKPEPKSENPNIQLNSRSSSGVAGKPSSQDSYTIVDPASNNSNDIPITWDEAYSQSARRVVVRVKDVGNPNIVRLHRVGNDDFTKSHNLNPPPHEQVAKMARFIVHNSNWTSMATISSRTPIVGFPFANIFSISDGPLKGNASGIPYMYMTPLDISVMDLQTNSKSSLTMSLAQSNYCRLHSYDPEDPRCAHVILTGNMVEINNGTGEFKFARKALFSRHPDMSGWPQDHGWFFAKLNISHIMVLDYFGGAKSVTPEDYFQANL